MNGASPTGLHRFFAAAILASFLAACSGGGISPSGSPAGTNANGVYGGAANAKSFAGASISASRTRIAHVLEHARSGARAMAVSTTPSNPTTADPPVPRPNEAPCTVQLYSNFQFTSFTYPTFPYAPPANCPGPWAKVVLDADFAVTAGVQFDRTGSIWINGTNIYFGTTAEPAPGYAPQWHIEKDVTDLTPVFETPSTGEVVLGNIVNSTYTSIISSSAKLSFYPANDRYHVADVPDAVYPLSGGPLGDNQYITTPTQPLTATYTLPTNVRAAYLDVYLQSQIGDEFWYTCFPDSLAAQIPNCGNTAFREGDVAIDGQAAGVSPVYPWIYTGGIDPFLWQPIPGVETLNFKAYRVNLTPFAALLSNGQPHTINVTVFNNGNYFAANATLLVYLDHGLKQITGGIISNTTQLQPNPQVVQNVTFNNGVGTGTVSVKSLHTVSIDGYVNTSHGRVETKVNQFITFSNVQKVDGNSTGSLFDQNIKQDTNIVSNTTTIDGWKRTTASETREYPLNIIYDFSLNTSTNIATQFTSLSQAKNEQGFGPGGAWFSSNHINGSDTLGINFTTSVLTPSNPATSQTYTARGFDFCWNKTVSAKNGVVTEQIGGPC